MDTVAWTGPGPVTAKRVPARGRVRLFEQEVLTLESGAALSPVEVGFETWGTLSEREDNIVMVCHALTGDAHVASHGPVDSPGWWEAYVGPGRAIDTDRWFVLATNALGSDGSCGPTSPGVDGRPYGLNFPFVTVRDMIHVQRALLDALGIPRLALVIGGSLGGMQALEWAALYPERVGAAASVGATPRFSAIGIALNELQRRVILLGMRHNDGAEALAIARGLGMLSYRSALQLKERFGRTLQEGHEMFEPGHGFRFAVGSYLDHQGERFVGRFHPETYVTLSRAMDFHDLTRGRTQPFPNGAPALFLAGLQEDWLFSPEEIGTFCDEINTMGLTADYQMIPNRVGHDAFLIDHEPMQAWIHKVVEAAAQVQ